jgi:hypothetical protein
VTLDHIPLTHPGALLADQAHDTARNLGPCCLCQRAMLAGEHVARLVSTGQWAHAGCVSAGR